jgi:formiminoglutamase
MAWKDLVPYLQKTHFVASDTARYNPHQLGASIITSINNDAIYDAKIVIVGCQLTAQEMQSADVVRKKLYALYNWHSSVAIADIGNIQAGASDKDTLAALNFVCELLHSMGKKIIVIGDKHQLTMSQYQAFVAKEELIDATVVDMLMDLEESETIDEHNFLFPLLTNTPNYIKSFNLLAFQSYFTSPTMVETLDRLQFDCHRLGKVREELAEMEPIFRQSDLVSIDINSVKYSDAPCHATTSPNGLHGDEICQLSRYAGMSDKCCSYGIYGYNASKDTHELTATLIAQMIWYFVDGVYFGEHEANFTDDMQYNQFHLHTNGHDISFLHSKRTNRWWMQLPNKSYAACTRKDYLIAANNELPDRWLREAEKIV